MKIQEFKERVLLLGPDLFTGDHVQVIQKALVAKYTWRVVVGLGPEESIYLLVNGYTETTKVFHLGANEILEEQEWGKHITKALISALDGNPVGHLITVNLWSPQ